MIDDEWWLRMVKQMVINDDWLMIDNGERCWYNA